MLNKITHFQLRSQSELSRYEQSAFLDTADLILVNGNHEKANHQIVIIDPKKEASLIKRKDSLTHVIALVKTDDEEIPAYIKQLIPNYKSLPVYSISEIDAIGKVINDFLDNRMPLVKGLILGGGKSTRMGVDKLSLTYHNVPQYEYLNNIMMPLCSEVFVSCRSEQELSFPNIVVDSFVGLGAYGGLLSAFQKDPNAAWFSVACDIPLLNKETLDKLFSKRNPSKLATCFYNSETEFPEPLITIWEPRAYPVLLKYLSLGYSCTRKVLINNNVEVVKLQNEEVLLNANTPLEQEQVMALLSNTIS